MGDPAPTSGKAVATTAASMTDGFLEKLSNPGKAIAMGFAGFMDFAKGLINSFHGVNGNDASMVASVLGPLYLHAKARTAGMDLDPAYGNRQPEAVAVASHIPAAQGPKGVRVAEINQVSAPTPFSRV